MSRATLRLVEPLESAISFPQGKFQESGVKTISNINEVHSFLQLFLTWPEYSSSCAKVGEDIVKVEISFDSALSELEQLYLTFDHSSYEKIKLNKSVLERVYLEVFGITFGLDPSVDEVTDNFDESQPNVAIAIPSLINRYNMRGTRRVRVENEQKVSIRINEKDELGTLVDVSPNAFSINLKVSDENPVDRAKVTINDIVFDALICKSLTGMLLIKPLKEEAENFGKFFEIYCAFAYPSLRSRYSFKSDPIPDLMNRTGQAKKHALNEVNSTWTEEVGKAYLAAKDAKDLYCADFVAVDNDATPIGTSSLAKVYLDTNGNHFWAFHGVGIVQDPKYLDQTCMLYLWRADYVLSRDPNLPIVVWFDGRGRWLEKVYTKFQRLTSEATKLTSIKHNRYVRKQDVNVGNFNPADHWQFIKIVKTGTFERFMASDGSLSIGIGVPFLNYSGILNNLIYWNDESITPKQRELVNNTVGFLKPDRFFIETPFQHSDIQIDGYEHFLVDATNRQCLTKGEALPFFSSSLEHSKAVVKKKYGHQ